MTTTLTPYDTGWRLQPHVWTTTKADLPDRFGRVDFEDDFSDTVLTAWVQKNEDGSYIMRIDEHAGATLTIETSSQRHERSEAMDQLTAAIEAIVAEHPGSLEYTEEDPDAFGLGHFVFHDAAGTQRLAITEDYIGTDSSDADRIPNGWSWSAESYSDADGTNDWVEASSGEINAKDVAQLISALTEWVSAQTKG